MYHQETEAEERLRLEDDKPQADDAGDDDEEELAGNNGYDNFSVNGDEDEFSDHESITGDAVTKNATVI